MNEPQTPTQQSSREERQKRGTKNARREAHAGKVGEEDEEEGICIQAGQNAKAVNTTNGSKTIYSWELLRSQAIGCAGLPTSAGRAHPTVVSCAPSQAHAGREVWITKVAAVVGQIVASIGDACGFSDEDCFGPARGVVAAASPAGRMPESVLITEGH